MTDDQDPGHKANPLLKRVFANLDAGLPLPEAGRLALEGKVRVKTPTAPAQHRAQQQEQG